MRTSWLPVLFAFALVVGCGSRRGHHGDGDADADSDSDGDTDADGDADPPVCSLGCPAGYECALGVCEGGDPRSLTLDVPTVPVSGSITMNGARPGTGTDCGGCPDCGKAGVAFRSAAGSSFDATIPCSSSAYTFALDLPPDTYAISVYAYGESYSALPPGTSVLDPARRIDAAASDLTFDVSTVPVSGTITMNGARPGTGTDCGGCPDCGKANVGFSSAAGASYSATIPCSSSSYAFAIELPPDTYSVNVTAYGESYSALPPGTAVLDPSFTIGAAASGLTFDVPTVSVSGNVTLNGARPGTGTDCSGCPDCGKAGVSFVSPAGASFTATIPCSSTAYAFALDLPPDTYAVSVHAYGESYSALPPGSAVLDPSFTIGAAASGLSFDVPTVSVSGNVTLNGARPGTGTDCSGCPECGKANVNFIGDAGASFSATIPCSSTAYAFALDLPPATYAVSVYAYGESYSALPPGTAILDPSLAIGAAASGLTFDVPTVPVSGNITMNGARPGTGTDCSGCPDCGKANVSFTSATGSSFSATIPCSSSAYAFSLDVPPDAYAVGVYAYGESYSALPPGTAALVRSLRIP